MAELTTGLLNTQANAKAIEVVPRLAACSAMVRAIFSDSGRHSVCWAGLLAQESSEVAGGTRSTCDWVLILGANGQLARN